MNQPTKSPMTNGLARKYAGQFQSANDEIISLVTACSDEQWRQPTSSETWSVAVVAHHVATVHRDFTGIVRKLASGESFSPSSSMEMVDRKNAEHAQDYANVGKPETLALLRANGSALEQ